MALTREREMFMSGMIAWIELSQLYLAILSLSLDHHVVNKTCVKCGEGLTNLAGDDESGDDTECRGYGSGAGDVYGERSLFTAVAVALVTVILDNMHVHRM